MVAWCCLVSNGFNQSVGTLSVINTISLWRRLPTQPGLQPMGKVTAPFLFKCSILDCNSNHGTVLKSMQSAFCPAAGFSFFSLVVVRRKRSTCKALPPQISGSVKKL